MRRGTTVGGTVALLFSLACNPEDKLGKWEGVFYPYEDQTAKITLDLDEPSGEVQFVREGGESPETKVVSGGGVVTQSGPPQVIKTDNDETFTL